MPSITVDVDVDLDKFSDDEIIAEFKDRLRSTRFTRSELEEIADVIGAKFVDDNFENITPKTLDGYSKLEHLSKIFNKYTSFQIEAALPDKL